MENLNTSNEKPKKIKLDFSKIANTPLEEEKIYSKSLG